ncbi:hypothetical protein HGA92_00190 [Candidatus Gracilibacteria bacterium]|nr:hypothetical protein [Candidatus Gracilibacteria bacterium]NUJ98970.1 hypothetical protein [Candidatus Gracilibacteria bacterium]
MEVNQISPGDDEKSVFIVENIPLSLEEKTNEELPGWSQDDTYIYHLYDGNKTLAIFHKDNLELPPKIISSDLGFISYNNGNDIIFLKLIAKIKYLINPETGEIWKHNTSGIFCKDEEIIYLLGINYLDIYKNDSKIYENNQYIAKFVVAGNYVIFRTRLNEIFKLNLKTQRKIKINDFNNNKKVKNKISIDKKGNYASIFYDFSLLKNTELFINGYKYNIGEVSNIRKFDIIDGVLTIIYEDKEKNLFYKKIKLNESLIKEGKNNTQRKLYKILNIN